jgi:hypothetical protein
MVVMAVMGSRHGYSARPGEGTRPAADVNASGTHRKIRKVFRKIGRPATTHTAPVKEISDKVSLLLHTLKDPD